MYPDEFEELLIDTVAEFGQLPKSSQVAYCLFSLEAEVNNGGFHQFFGNSSGLFVQQTLWALAEIGANKTRLLLENAIRIAYPNEYPSDPSQHEATLCDDDEVLDLLGPVDESFYAYEEDLSGLVNRYLSRAT